MVKNNSSNQDYTNNSDGWDLTGGTTSRRKLTVTGGDVTVTGSGANTHTFQNISGTVYESGGTDVSVSDGGTGSSTASGARTSLGAAASGANGDITSLTGLTTPLTIGQGGTGSATQNFVDLTTAQTVGGAKTLSSALTLSGATGNTLVADTNSLVVNATNHRVGIGTASPAYPLDVNGTFSQTSGTAAAVRIQPTYNQTSGTAANTDLLVNRVQTAVGSGTQLLADFQVGGSSKFSISNAGHVTTEGVTSTGATGTGKLVFDTSPTLVTPVVATIDDANSNAMLSTAATASAVNNIQIGNAATNGAPYLTAVGTDTNISLNIFAKASGAVILTNPQFSTIKNTGTLTLPTSTDTLVGQATTNTLTNKDLTSGTNTFPTFNQDTTGKSAKADALNSATTTVSVSSATAPTNGQVLTATSSTAATWQTPSASVADASTTVKGIVQLTGDLGGTAASPTTPTALHITGNESAAGTKTFTTGITVSGAFAATQAVRFGNLISTTSAITLTTASVYFQDGNAASNAITYTLPATTTAGLSFVIKKIDSSANAVTVSATSIDGASTYVLSAQYQWVVVKSTATSGTWNIVGFGPLAVADASPTVKGIVQLTGALGGTATAPTTPTAVHITGNESIAGTKTFTGNVNVGSIGTATGQEYVGGVVPTAALGSVTTGTATTQSAIQGRYAYVTNNTANTVQAVDVSNPASPVVISTLSMSSIGTATWGIAVSGNYAYITSAGGSELSLIDISNPASMTIAGSVATSGGPVSVAVQGRYAYVANNTGNTIQAIDVSNPASPVVVGSATITNPYSVAVQGRYAYVAGNSSNLLQVYDISTPASITSTGSISTGASSNPYSVAVQGRYAYVANYGTGTLKTYDVSNPASITSAGSVSTGTAPSSVTVQGRFAYVTNWTSNTLQLFDISNPSSPASLGTVATGTKPMGVTVQGRFAYVTNYTSNTLQSFDLGGIYTQSLEAGSIETSNLTVNQALTLNQSASIAGGLQVSQAAQFGQDVGVGGIIKIAGPGSTNWATIRHSGAGGNLHLDSTTGAYLNWFAGSGSQGLTVGNGTASALGPVTASAFYTSSSRRLKTDIRDTHYGLNDLLQLQPVEYSYIADPDAGNQVGMIAEDVNTIYPEAVAYDDQGLPKALDYSKFVPLIIESIKDIAGSPGITAAPDGSSTPTVASLHVKGDTTIDGKLTVGEIDYLTGFNTVTRKTDQAAIANSTTLQDDDTLHFGMTAGASYVFTALIPVDASDASAQLSYTFTAPAGAVVNISTIRSNAAGNVVGNIMESGAVCSEAIPSNLIANGFIQVKGYILNGSTAGDLQFQFSQNQAANVAFPVVKKGASLSWHGTE